jgi:hypothetical protein
MGSFVRLCLSIAGIVHRFHRRFIVRRTFRDARRRERRHALCMAGCATTSGIRHSLAHTRKPARAAAYASDGERAWALARAADVTMNVKPVY